MSYKKNIHADNPSQSIWCKVKKSSKIGQEHNIIISAFP